MLYLELTKHNEKQLIMEKSTLLMERNPDSLYLTAKRVLPNLKPNEQLRIRWQNDNDRTCLVMVVSEKYLSHPEFFSLKCKAGIPRR